MTNKKRHTAKAKAKEPAGAALDLEPNDQEGSLGSDTYSRSDGATMVKIAPHSYLSAAHLAIASGRRAI